MSLNMLNSYEQDFTFALNNLRQLMKDESKLNSYFRVNSDPLEYEQASNSLKQMEIESMNFMESDEYAQNRKEGDLIRKKIQKHKREFDLVRKQMRDAHLKYDKVSGASTDWDDAALDLEHN